MSEQEERSAIGDSICALIRETRRGSTLARDQLLTQLRSYVSLVAARNPAPDLRAKIGQSDLVQESMAIAVEKFDQFQGRTEAELQAWVTRILENEVRQAKRSFRSLKRDIHRERPLDHQSNDPRSGVKIPWEIADRELTPQTLALQNENQLHVQRALEQIPEEHRQVIQLRNWEKLTFEEIGHRMNRTENAATKLWYRALIALRKAMVQDGE